MSRPIDIKKAKLSFIGLEKAKPGNTGCWYRLQKLYSFKIGQNWENFFLKKGQSISRSWKSI